MKKGGLSAQRTQTGRSDRGKTNGADKWLSLILTEAWRGSRTMAMWQGQKVRSVDRGSTGLIFQRCPV